MKIVFICGSLELGKDGVGDYTRRLACELLRQGHEAEIIGLCDKHTESKWEGFQQDATTHVKVFRLPASLSWKKRREQTIQIIKNYSPDCISLQLVLFSFHKKGLPFGLAAELKRVSCNAKWHIMFHELWVGIKKDSPFSHFIYKPLQQMIIKKLNQQLTPLCIHTNNIVFQLELKRKNISSKILSLFSNIQTKLLTNESKEELYATLNMDTKSRTVYFLIAIFGGIHHVEEVMKAVKEVSDTAKKNNKVPYLLLFGRNGMSKDLMINELNKESILTHLFGEVSEEIASYLMQISDLAISCTPEEFIGKSGIYAAFRAHGLPVKQSSHILIPQYAQAILEFNDCLEKKAAHEWQVSFIAKQFIHDLRLHTNV